MQAAMHASFLGQCIIIYFVKMILIVIYEGGSSSRISIYVRVTCYQYDNRVIYHRVIIKLCGTFNFPRANFRVVQIYTKLICITCIYFLIIKKQTNFSLIAIWLIF